MRYLLLVVLVMPLMCHARQSEKSIEVTLPAKQVHEECVDMTPGQTLRYRFESSAELDFNLHFHQGNDVTYPDKGKYSNYSSSYSAQQTNAFCLMWENQSGAAIKLQSTFQIESPTSK
ncbi:MAG: hypothetical protein WCD07_04500 [Burkholderiales bacterium]